MAVKRKSHAASETTLRHVWLASLGLVAITRREALAAPARLVARVDAWQRRVQDLADSAGARVRDQVEPRVVQLSSEVEARLAPVLDKLGLKPKGRRPARKPGKAGKAVKKSQARRSVRQPAKRVARRG